MNYRSARDREFWKRCIDRGDENAFGELFERYFPRMSGVAKRYLKDDMSAEEVVMDCFFNIWARRDRINIEGDFHSYLFGCVRNAIVSRLRNKIQMEVNLEMVESRYMSEYAADSAINTEDIVRTYIAALEKMPPRRRQAFLMSRKENLSYKEIAQKMNISVSAVDNYITSSLEFLRTRMKGHLMLLLSLLSVI